MVKLEALIVQWIEYKIADLGIEVRIPLGAQGKDGVVLSKPILQPFKGRKEVKMNRKERLNDQEVADRARELKARIKRAHKEIRELQDRDFKKTGVRRSRVQLLCRFRQELKQPFAAMLVISQVESNLKREIERHPNDRRLLEDLVFAQQQKSLLLESHPRLVEQMKEAENWPTVP